MIAAVCASWLGVTARVVREPPLSTGTRSSAACDPCRADNDRHRSYPMAKTWPHREQSDRRGPTETGKGASRRARREGKVPAVLYGHGTDPQHLVLRRPRVRRRAAQLRHQRGSHARHRRQRELALPKELEIHPIRRNIQHVDLLIVRRGEKVTVEVNVVVEGDAGPDTLVNQESNTIEIESDAMSIPEHLTLSVEGTPPARSSSPRGAAARRRHADLRPRDAGGQRRPRADRRGPRGRGRRRGRPSRGEARRARAEAAEGGEAAAPSPSNPVGGLRRGRTAAGRRPWQSRTALRTTRHNLGFLVADILADRLGSGFKVHKKSGAEVITGRLGGRSIVLAKPRVYMNESGRQVGPLAKFYSVPPADVVVIHDELDIDFGRIRLKFGGGVAGHNGLRSVASALGTNDFQRVRIGIGRPPGRMEGATFVLGELHYRRMARGPDDLRAGRRRH